MKSSPDDILLHTLGIRPRHDTDYDREPYRNHYVAGPGHRPPGFLGESDMLFACTDLGKARALSVRAKRRPKLTRGQLRYRRWLDISDCCPDLTFGQWLLDGCQP